MNKIQDNTRFVRSAGLYTSLVLIPAVALSPGGYDTWALAGWQIPFLLLGLALYQQGAAPLFRETTVGA
jgi:hypothetical protein